MKKIFSFFLTVFPAILFAQQIDVQHYNFAIQLHDTTDAIDGRAIITTKFLQPTSSATFNLVSVKKSLGMNVYGVFYNGLPLDFKHEENLLTIYLKKKVEKNAIGDFEIQYDGIPANGLIISQNKFGDRTFFADNWPNRAHHWIPCIDKPNDKATFEFFVTAPSVYKIISNGVLVQEQKLNSNFTTTHWKTNIALPTKVMVIGAAKFAVKHYADSPKDIPVSAWIYPQDTLNGFRSFSTAPEILKFFSTYIAPYPFEKLANVQSTTMFGGMENASAIFYSENSVTGKTITGKNDVEELMAHEIAHQWFGDMASEKNFAHLWLSEGFATYLTNIYLQQKHGDEVFKKRLEEDRKQIIEFVKENNHPVVDSSSAYMDLLNANSYQKGGWILHMLRNEVDDKTFQKILQTYYQQYKGSNADTRDFEAVAEKVSGQELTWFFNQWLYRPGIPQLKMETKIQDNEFTLYVKQKDKPYHFYLEIEIVEEDGRTFTERFEVKEKESKFTVPVKGSSIQFYIDPKVKLLYELK